MKKYISNNQNNTIETIHVTMYLRPIFYENSEIFSSISYDPKTRKYQTDVNPSRIINGPLTGIGEELEPPIREEWKSFTEDCRSIVTDLGFTILKSYQSTTSKKSEYIIMIGLNDQLYGKLVFDLRISDHSLDDFKFPDGLKDEILDILKMNHVLDGSATEAGIDFQIEQVLVGSVKNDTWNRALNRLLILLRRLKFHARNRIDAELESNED